MYQILIGAFIGWLVFKLMDYFGKPQLVVNILLDKLNTQSAGHKFLHLKVENKKRSLLEKILFGEKAALFCKANISFLNQELNNIFDKSFLGSWASTGEPVLQLGEARQFQYNKVPDLSFVHILPGESVNLAVAIKIKGESEFYAFDNESYAYLDNSFRDPIKKINLSFCFLEVGIVSSDGFYKKNYFKILNNKELKDFILKSLTLKEDLKFKRDNLVQPTQAN
ncbi:MAG: hypothetical protein M1355_02215 [Patescibacteria group bacterium]|nr:hypothetical protein [Patescibacteria group bacterium]